MITPDEALDLVARTAVPLPAQHVAVEESVGLVAARDVAADRPYPPFARSMMDGFAVRLADAGTWVEILGQVPAGTVWQRDVPPGSCLEIFTGAPCPPAAEAVVQLEHVRREENRVLLPASIRPAQNIAAPGSDCPAGQRVLAAGETVTAMAVAALASFGLQRLQAIPRPTLGIITTGGELASGHGEPPAGTIRNSNGPMLAAMARAAGIDRPSRHHAPDRLHDILDALAGMEGRDIVVLTGGVSVGAYDLVPQALARHGAVTVFHGVRQKPGKPLLFARKGDRLFFGLPGNPLACHLGFHRYVAAAIRRLSGRPAAPPPLRATLASPVEGRGGRTHFLPARAEPAAAGGWSVDVLPARSSADIFHGVRANCYVEFPPVARQYLAGDDCCFTWLDTARGDA